MRTQKIIVQSPPGKTYIKVSYWDYFKVDGSAEVQVGARDRSKICLIPQIRIVKVLLPK